MEFDWMDPRLHYNWVGGECKKPPMKNPKSVTGRMFSEGTAVEVSFQKEDYEVWHVGTVMEVTGNNKCLVKYQCLGNVDEHKIQEFADSPDIRPSPPSLEESVFRLLDKVEAYFECCWWSGVVRRLLDNSRYVVLIKHAKKEMTFDHTNLRPRMVWTDGKWIDQAKDTKRLYVLSYQSENSNRQKRGAKEQQDGNGCASTEKKDNTGVHVEEIIEKECLEEVDMSVKEVKGAVFAKKCEFPRKNEEKKQSRGQKIHTVDGSNGSTEGSKRKRGRPKTLFEKQIGEGSTKLSAENNCLMPTTVDDFQPSSKDNVKVITSDRRLRSGVHRHNGLLSKTKDIPMLEDQTGETVPRKRVTRPKNAVSNGHVEMSRNVDSESPYQDLLSTAEGHDALRGKTSVHEIYHAKDDDMLIDELGDINDDQPLSIWLDKLSPMGSDDSRTLPVQHQCANTNGRHDDFGALPVAKEDRMEPSPLEKTDGPNQGDLPAENLNECAKSNDKCGKLGSPSGIVNIDNNTENNQNLPFVKCSPLWENVNSMEIFQKTTQKPHFSPLSEKNEASREGLAIGHMVNFSNLATSTSKLQLSSEMTTIKSYFETLTELESHGFDVEAVRACLTRLLSTKQMGEELLKEYDSIASEISTIVDEKGKLDEEVTQLYQKLKEIRKKLAEAESRKKTRETTISTLQSRQDVIGQDVQSLQLEFESIAGSLYGN